MSRVSTASTIWQVDIHELGIRLLDTVVLYCPSWSVNKTTTHPVK